MIKKICVVAALTTAAIFGSTGAASADSPGTEFRGWTWWLGTGVAEIADEIVGFIVGETDSGEVVLFPELRG
ncbi:hypothetical protein [Thermobifida cellulosilytica]|uniref:Uncharacterized protein n=1 Tax=Thermobifida cellulosilytica TB100 TaxID=665004 RepID=A0A147KK38_THECS|nr:hypothetical protein [Thermobifida cellulosilytica]KUP97599.1 hypothetical protein AC529_05940 [Thermobifida cellulosilytica TB100]